METLIAVGTVENVLKRVFSRTNIDTIKLALGFDEELKRLRSSVSGILSFLADADQNHQIDWRLHRPWLMELEELGYDADHALEELNYEILRRKVEMPKQQMPKTKSKKVLSISYYLSASNPTVFRRKMNHKLREINGKLEVIIKAPTGEEFRLPTTVGSSGENRSSNNTLISQRDVNDSAAPGKVVGREKDVAQVVKILTTRRRNEFASVLIVEGSHGLGKTTLARQVYDHSRIGYHFDKKIWISAAGEFETRRLIKLILEEQTQKSVSTHGVYEIMGELQKQMIGKRYLLVLDNLYFDDDFYDSFVYYVSQIESNKGNWWLITTRDATGLRLHPMSRRLPNFNFLRWRLPTFHSLSPLDDDDCLSIFKEYAFGGGREDTERPEIQPEIRRYIINICGGVPSIAKLLGSMLVHKADQQDWFSILTRLLDSCGDISPISMLSYYQLPSSSLKKCFAFCSNFTKDEYIDKEQLVQLWMAEGFLEHYDEATLDLEDIGYEIFYILLQYFLLEAVKKDEFGNITHCRVSLHDLAVSRSRYDSINLENPIGKEILVRHLKAHSIEEDDIPRGRYVRVHSKEGGSYKIETSSMRNLHTLILKSNISDDLLSNFKFLHVLNLSSADVEDLPPSIGKLMSLRYLDLSGTKIKNLPDSICKLYNLETLRILECSSLKVLPKDIANLICLRHLHFYHNEEFHMPPKMGQLTSLRTLLFYNLGQDEGQRIEELGHLKNLRGKIVIRKLDLVTSKAEAQSADLFEKILVYKLDYHWDDNRQGNDTDEKVLDGLQPHPELRSLTLRNYMADKLPLWVMQMTVRGSFQLYNLMELKLINCKRFRRIPMLGQLPFLQYLELKGLTNVTHIGPSFYAVNVVALSNITNGIGQSTTTLFPSLKRLKLDSMHNLVGWMDVKPTIEAFPCLENLTVQYCPRLTSIPCHLPAVKELKIQTPFIINNSMPLASICSSMTTLIELCIYSVSEITCLPSGLLFANRNLEILRISSCPNLTHVVPSFWTSGISLRELSVHGCKNLIELPQGLDRLSCLEILSIEECPNLTSFPNVRLTFPQHLKIAYCDQLSHLPRGVIESATNLRSLRISDCSNLSSLHLHLDNKIHLSSLWISNCPKCTSVLGELRLFHLSCLRELRIGCFSHSVHFDSFRECLSIPHELHSLGLYGLPQWTKLPNELIRTRALRLLILSNFGIEILPDWLGELSSLEELGLFRCKKLRDMPSYEAMKCLTKLRRLSIVGCPLVKKKCLQYYGPGSGWLSPKFELDTD